MHKHAMRMFKSAAIAAFSLCALTASAQGPTYGSKPGPNYHPNAQPKWPDGKDRKVDSGQHAVTSFFVDRRAKKWSLGVGAGPTFFFGDADKVQPSWHAKVFAKYSVSQTFGLRAEYNIGQLRGARDFQFPTLYKDFFQFKSKFMDYSVQAVFTLGNISFLRPLRKTQLNFFLGVGMGNFKSKANYNDQRLYIGGDYYLSHYLGTGTPNPNLGKDVEETYDGRHIILPYGFGIKHNLGRYFDIGLDYRQTYMRTDDIDVYNTAIWQNRWFDQYGMMTVYGAWKMGNKNPQHYDWLSPIESIYEKVQELDERVDSLSSDSDGDGVSDFFDVDDSTEKGCNVYGNGMAVDSDGDGIADCHDKEPFSDKGCEVDADGKMIDTDGDNVPDCRDLEINSPIGSQTDAQGRSIVNSCCNCEDMTFPSMFFDANKCNIKPEYHVVLTMIADKMKQCPDKKLTICGATGGKEKMYSGKKGDVVGSCRVENIINILVTQYGMSRDRIIVDNTCKSSDPNKIEFKFVGGKSSSGSTQAPGPRSSR
ncbi:MAG: outer membrane beta-barrel protein [Bacteroidetes bacterium]|nr:outer membrane beta-barrel protein [Bacteroidota bacterium]